MRISKPLTGCVGSWSRSEAIKYFPRVHFCYHYVLFFSALMHQNDKKKVFKLSTFNLPSNGEKNIILWLLSKWQLFNAKWLHKSSCQRQNWNKSKQVSQLFLVQREVLFNIKKVRQNLGPSGPLREPQSSPKAYTSQKRVFLKGGPINCDWPDCLSNTIVKMHFFPKKSLWVRNSS